MNSQMPAKTQENRLQQLHAQGQAVWLDFLSRRFIADGSLGKLIQNDGLSGITSNPSIFEKAIGGSKDYDASLKELVNGGDRDVMSLYEHLAVADIQGAADALRPVYDATKGADGFASLEVSPYLAMDTDATIAEARRLWREVNRENLMIKVPATEAGLPAIRDLIGEGINVNITLLFSQQVYVQVAEAYLAGLERLAAQGGDLRKIASVASFFVSRIDVAVEKLVDEKLQQSTQSNQRKTLEDLRGKVAIANAKLAYQHYKRLFSGARWEKLAARGARVQRLLWASTGRKNPAYSDVLYVDELIAPQTINTMPPETIEAFRDHGTARATLEQGVDASRQVMASLEDCGISIDAITARLVDEGVRSFADAFDKLLAAVADKRAALLGDRLNSQTCKLPPALEEPVKSTLESWRRAGNVRRLWAGDAGLWTGADESKWLGWLSAVDEQQKHLGDLTTLAQDVRKQNLSHVVLLGMGGSSLGAEVWAETFARQAGYPQLLVLDSTDPAEIRTIESKIDPTRTLFIVSSKSGSTLEPNALKQYFFERMQKAVGADKAGSHFIAITDPGSKLQAVAERDRFRRVISGIPSIGGRYSVLSNFGLVPAAAMGLDIGELLRQCQIMVRSCSANVPPAANPGVALGILLGALGKAGRDKVTIIASPGIAGLGAWLEQLLAESTGKQGVGLIPVDAEPLGSPAVYGKDRLFVYARLTGEADAAQDAAVAALETAGHPVVRIGIASRDAIGQEFFRWEIATAVAGAVLGINPFDQPDVEASKDETRALTAAYEKSGQLPPETALGKDGDMSFFAGANDRKAFGDAKTLAGYLAAHLARIHDGDYCALLAYIERNDIHRATFQDIRALIRDRKRVATCVGFGPRFLHSTGQAYKGGPDSGVFLQITCDDAADVAVPGQKYSFGVVKAAQARGDFEVLVKRQRRVLRIHLSSHVAAGLTRLKDGIRQALQQS